MLPSQYRLYRFCNVIYHSLFCDCFLKQYLYCFCTFKENECLKALSVLEENGRMEQLLSYLQMFHHAISLVFLFLIFEPIKS